MNQPNLPKPNTIEQKRTNNQVRTLGREMGHAEDKAADGLLKTVRRGGWVALIYFFRGCVRVLNTMPVGVGTSIDQPSTHTNKTKPQKPTPHTNEPPKTNTKQLKQTLERDLKKAPPTYNHPPIHRHTPNISIHTRAHTINNPKKHAKPQK